MASGQLDHGFNEAYEAFRKEWWSIPREMTSVYNITQAEMEHIRARLEPVEDRYLQCLRSLLLPGIQISFDLASVYSAPEDPLPNRDICGGTLIQSVEMLISPYSRLVRFPYAFINADSKEGIWLDRVHSYEIGQTGQRIYFNGWLFKLESVEPSRQGV